MMSEEIAIRQATLDDLDAVAHLRMLGFGGSEASHRTDLENNPRYNYRHVILAEVEGKPAGTAMAFPTQMWISGVPLQMGAVAAVTTHPDFRGRGIASAMMQRLLENMAQNGMSISVLFPMVHSIYKQCGYAPAAVWHAYSIKPDNLPVFNEANRVRLFKMEDLSTVRSIYRGGQLSQADGRLTRSSMWWDKSVAEEARTGNRHVVVYEGETGVEGYLKYTVNHDKVLNVTEMFVASHAAYRGLWGYLASHPDITSIDYLAPADDPILHLLKRPRDSYGGNRGWVFDDIYHATASIMIRVINVVEALTSRFYRHDMMGNRILKIHDPQLPKNQEPVNFRIVDGRPDIIPLDNESPQIEIDIATFSQIICGFLSPETAHRLGWLQADGETVAWLSKAMVANPIFIHKGDWF